MCIHVIRGLNALTAVAIGLACLSLLPLISGCGTSRRQSRQFADAIRLHRKLNCLTTGCPSAAFSEASESARTLAAAPPEVPAKANAAVSAPCGSRPKPPAKPKKSPLMNLNLGMQADVVFRRS